MMYLKVLLGFVFLLGSADILVRGAVGLARRMEIPPIIIGMTIIAFGTSAPELLVSMDAAIAGSSGMALGNVVGSNIANMLMIVGVAALLKPISIKPYALMRDGMVLLGSSLLFGWFCWLGTIEAWQGGVLLVILFVFLARAYWRDSHDGGVSAEIHIEEVKEFEGLKTLWSIWMAILAGLAGVVFGADLLVDGGVEMAKTFGIADEVIGLTVLAIGTSLPELAASVVAAMRGHTDVALGNVVGSNLFNILAVVGAVALVMPLEVPQQLLDFDLWLMLGVTVLMLPYLIGGWRLGRSVAVSFLVGYAAYVSAQVYGVAQLMALFG
ncbi:MAG TPA: calcium/sodium antiporter [Rhodospirillales bacterium]|nr:calcium/sodium antiporter [Rhodospirillales bacterium]